MKFLSKASLVLLIATLNGPAHGSDPRSLPGQIAFDVYLDDSRIGTHNYEFVQSEAATSVASSASFDVKFLFFTAYRYRHTVEERWTDGCLENISAETTANGKQQRVNGERKSGAFVVSTGDVTQSVDDCVMSFAYWNRDFLKQSRLLNPQTGEYLAVSINEVDVEQLDEARKRLGSSAFRVQAKDLNVTVWYSDDGDWVGLESETDGGRTLRYEIT